LQERIPKRVQSMQRKVKNISSLSKLVNGRHNWDNRKCKSGSVVI
jgi:cytochrome c556